MEYLSYPLVWFGNLLAPVIGLAKGAAILERVIPLEIAQALGVAILLIVGGRWLLKLVVRKLEESGSSIDLGSALLALMIAAGFVVHVFVARFSLKSYRPMSPFSSGEP